MRQDAFTKKLRTEQRASLLGATLLGAPGLTTRNKDATRSNKKEKIKKIEKKKMLLR